VAQSNVYQVQFSPADTSATDAHAIFDIWNPSSTRRIELLEIGYFAVGTPGAGMGFLFRRATARGTGGSTVTPTADHHTKRDAAPDSGFVIDLAAFSGQPTLDGDELGPTWVSPAVAASGVVLPIPRGIEIPPGTGLACVNRAAVAFQDGDWWVVVGEL
jgi:hypothetical protein